MITFEINLPTNLKLTNKNRNSAIIKMEHIQINYHNVEGKIANKEKKIMNNSNKLRIKHFRARILIWLEIIKHPLNVLRIFWYGCLKISKQFCKHT